MTADGTLLLYSVSCLVNLLSTTPSIPPFASGHLCHVDNTYFTVIGKVNEGLLKAALEHRAILGLMKHVAQKHAVDSQLAIVAWLA